MITGENYSPGDTLTVDFARVCDNSLGATLYVARNVTSQELAERPERGGTSYQLWLTVGVPSGIRGLDVVLPTQTPPGTYTVIGTCASGDAVIEVFNTEVSVDGDPEAVETETVSVTKVGSRSFLITAPAPNQSGTGWLFVNIQRPDRTLPVIAYTLSIGTRYPLTVEVLINVPDVMPADDYKIAITGAEKPQDLTIG